MERPDLESLVSGSLNARLDRGVARPLAVALSGGGDSLALLLATKAWADGAGRRLVVLTVDHRLQAASAGWAAWCADRAARLGIQHRTLTWDGETLATPAAARVARHRLIAEAARAAGARVVLFGHTSDDVRESQLMRVGGVRVSSPDPWSPSPVWPEGRDLFIARPLLAVGRAEIRAWLAARGETWIEDPANANPAHPRARARALLEEAELEIGAEQGSSLTHALTATVGPAGDVRISGAAPQPELSAAVACASGDERPPRSAAVARLASRLQAGVVAATLGGARITREGEQLHVVREAGDARSRACAPLALPAHETVVWDGRFEVTARGPTLTVAPLAGRSARLDPAARRRLVEVPSFVRPSLPALIDAKGAVACPTLDEDPRLEIRNLVPGRLAGACGKIVHEAQIGLLG